MKMVESMAACFSNPTSRASPAEATLYRAAGNALISDILVNLLEKAQWLKNASPSSPRRMKLWFAELERVLEAID